MAQPVVGSRLCHTGLRLLLLDYGLLRMMLRLLFGYLISSQLLHLVYAGYPCLGLVSGGGAEILQATDQSRDMVPLSGVAPFIGQMLNLGGRVRWESTPGHRLADKLAADRVATVIS